jgi:hypothetical protein
VPSEEEQDSRFCFAEVEAHHTDNDEQEAD